MVYNFSTTCLLSFVYGKKPCNCCTTPLHSESGRFFPIINPNFNRVSKSSFGNPSKVHSCKVFSSSASLLQMDDEIAYSIVKRVDATYIEAPSKFPPFRMTNTTTLSVDCVIETPFPLRVSSCNSCCYAKLVLLTRLRLSLMEH